MMIEPPGEARIGGVLEVHDGVDVAGKQAGVEPLRGFGRQAGEVELGVGRKLGVLEPREERRGGGSGEQMAVQTYPRRRDVV